MTFLKENFEIIVVILLIITIVLVFLVANITRYFAMYFSNKKFLINSTFDVDAATSNKEFSISIFNKNINDIRVAGFGYVYKGRNIDFYKSYLKDMGLPLSQKLVIFSRDYLTARIDIEVLKNIVSDINKGKTSVEGIQAFVTDSQGLTTFASANPVEVQIHNELKKDKALLKAKFQEQRKKEKEEKKLDKRKKRTKRHTHYKETLGKFMLKIRRLFSRKKA